MLLIECPWCGKRDESEFRWGGPMGVVRPPLQASDQEWAEYLYVRENPKGLNSERWLHVIGCNQWFTLERDTVTHAITAVRKLPEPAA